MRKCRFCETMDCDLIESERGIECNDEEPCNERALARIGEGVPEEVIERDEYIREVFGEQWWDAALAGDGGAGIRLLVMLRPETWGTTRST